MSKLDELIQELCPKGVEYKHFEDICDVITDYTAAGSFKDIANNVKYIKSPSYAQLVRTTDLKNKFSDNSKFVYVDEHAYNIYGEFNWMKNPLYCLMLEIVEKYII